MHEARTQRRRLAAILAADIVGYSKLIRADEDGTIARVRALRRELVDPKVAKHSGRIVKVMGDGILIEFPSAVDAVRAAVEIQQAMAARATDVPEDERIMFRAGINLGDVVVEGEDIHGDGVNVATRLEGLAPPGGICISDGVHDQVRDRTAFAFRDLGARDLKNIDRPVRVWEWKPGGGVSRVENRDERLSSPERPSIAVLPFQNMSGDPEQEYFADGIAEDIITALSRIEWFFVIARNSSFTYKGRAVDVKQVGRELGVRYVLEGSVRRAGQRLRVTAQLIDAITGAHVWAERHDRDLSDIFEVQDEITRSVVASTQTQIQIAEGSLSDGIEQPSLPVWALVSRSWKLMYGMTAESLSEAIRLAEEAVSLDPQSGRAHQALASALFHFAWLGFADDATAIFARGRRMAEQAVRLNPRDEYAHWVLGMLKLVKGEHDKAIAELERAIEINPNCSLAYGSLATAQNFAGFPERAIKNNEIAVRANPRDPGNFFRFSGLAISHFLTGQLVPAIDWARKSVNLKPEWHQGHVVLIASLVDLGRLDEARVALADYRVQCPGASLEQVRRMPFRNPAHFVRFIDALRASGCPENLPDRPPTASGSTG